MGIDVGTSTAKVVLADPYGLFLFKKSASYEHASPLPGYAEQDPADWWGAVCSLTQELFKEQSEMQQRVAAVGVSGQGAGAILIDGGGATIAACYPLAGSSLCFGCRTFAVELRQLESLKSAVNYQQATTLNSNCDGSRPTSQRSGPARGRPLLPPPSLRIGLPGIL